MQMKQTAIGGLSDDIIKESERWAAKVRLNLVSLF